MLTFILAIAACVLVMTALTYAELRQPAGPKWSDAPIGLRAFVWVTIASVVLLLLVGVVI
jgi:hypothetical protein